MRYLNKLICLVIALSFSVQALPQKILVDTEEILVASDSCSNSTQVIPQEPRSRKTVTTGQAIGIGVGCVIVTGVVVVALVIHTLNGFVDALTF